MTDLSAAEDRRLRDLQRNDPELAREYERDLATLRDKKTAPFARGGARARVRHVEQAGA